MTTRHLRAGAAPSFAELNGLTFGRTRPGRAHPRRDPDPAAHGGTGGDPADPPAGGDPTDPPADPPKVVKVTDAKEYKDKAKEARDATALAESLRAELEAEKNKNLSADEQALAADKQQAVTAAVSAKEVELTDLYETRIATLQGEIIDGIIATAIAGSGRKTDEFKTILSTLDKRQFLDDDGNVKKDQVKAWGTELAGAANSRPPRTGGTRDGAGAAPNRGFAQYLPEKN